MRTAWLDDHPEPEEIVEYLRSSGLSLPDWFRQLAAHPASIPKKFYPEDDKQTANRLVQGHCVSSFLAFEFLDHRLFPIFLTVNSANFINASLLPIPLTETRAASWTWRVETFPVPSCRSSIQTHQPTCHNRQPTNPTDFVGP